MIVRQKLPDDLLDHAPRLLAAVASRRRRGLHPVEACTQAGVLVANVPGANTDAVAEFVVAQMLAIARHAEAMHASHLSDGWGRARARTDLATELRGKTLGIVGVGAIGNRLADIAAFGFRMRVLGNRRDRTRLPAHVGYADLPELFAEADYVALACPLTPETKGLANAALLARMKPTAWLLNVARPGDRGGAVGRGACVPGGSAAPRSTSTGSSHCRRTTRCGASTTSCSRRTAPG